MAGATLTAVLGQPTTLLVVQYRHTLPRARTQSPAEQGWPHSGHPSIYLCAITIVTGINGAIALVEGVQLDAS
jgi:hypothetical protein